jgi:hypothetical protein
MTTTRPSLFARTATALALGAALTAGALGCATTTTESQGPATVVMNETAALQQSLFDYSDWAAVLARFVDDQGRVDYAALKENRDGLDRFVASIASVGPRTNPELFPKRADQLSYYINAYNALAVQNVLNRYPIKTVSADGFKQTDFFVTTRFQLDGKKTNLRDLLNDVIRNEYNEPRTHFALTAAAAGAPSLPRTPFLPALFEKQLEAATQKYLHTPENVVVERGTLQLSSVFDWYKTDFRPTNIEWIRQKAPDLQIPSQFTSYKAKPYNWALNDQALSGETVEALGKKNASK